MQYNLSGIWELIDMNSHSPSKKEKEKERVSQLEKIENKLLDSLDDNQKNLFSRLMDTISEISNIERQASFREGVRFATQFLLDATDLT